MLRELLDQVREEEAQEKLSGQIETYNMRLNDLRRSLRRLGLDPNTPAIIDQLLPDNLDVSIQPCPVVVIEGITIRQDGRRPEVWHNNRWWEFESAPRLTRILDTPALPAPPLPVDMTPAERHLDNATTALDQGNIARAQVLALVSIAQSLIDRE